MLIRNKEYLRSILFGIEDSLVSTTGFIAGISVGSQNNKVVILSTLVAIYIEGVSMGVSEYISDDTLEELDKVKRHRENPMVSGMLLCTAYLLTGIIPLAPVFFLSFPSSLIASLILALISLFVLGYIKGKLVKRAVFRSAIKMLVIGGVTTLLGIVIGLVFRLA